MFVGKFIKDPQLGVYKSQSGHEVDVTNFQLSIGHKFKKNNNETGSYTTLLNFEAWDSGANVICSKFKSGDFIMVESTARVKSGQAVFRVEHFERMPPDK